MQWMCQNLGYIAGHLGERNIDTSDTSDFMILCVTVGGWGCSVPSCCSISLFACAFFLLCPWVGCAFAFGEFGQSSTFLVRDHQELDWSVSLTPHLPASETKAFSAFLQRVAVLTLRMTSCELGRQLGRRRYGIEIRRWTIATHIDGL